ncbi:sigma-70 family RNA polymerase sigma factor [Eisenbergiella tayi]|uniref:RNA polymerase sigma factor SigX n=1 Tax=Eisenbergiella tayi TaxID=1432052 RepID=A0A1E3A4V5_9FIRM|nr:sigma-70 family RNA polymerase sigma factor [Eisenbergiella tayi]ODM03649.1 RNA polymerase sigma factor SigX [Eisenbergiella tayi]
MEAIPRDYGERCQFDRYCKLVLYHEALDYLREMQRRRDRETSFDALPQAEMDKLCMEDHYPSDSYIFSSHGYDLLIANELVADAFSSLSKDAQSILILRCVLDMTDQEIADLMGMSRSAVQRRRAKTLKELRTKLLAIMPEGG